MVICKIASPLMMSKLLSNKIKYLTTSLLFPSLKSLKLHPNQICQLFGLIFETFRVKVEPRALLIVASTLESISQLSEVLT